MVHFSLASSNLTLKQLLRSPMTSMSLNLADISLHLDLLAAFDIVASSLLHLEALSLCFSASTCSSFSSDSSGSFRICVAENPSSAYNIGAPQASGLCSFPTLHFPFAVLSRLHVFTTTHVISSPDLFLVSICLLTDVT